MRGANVSLVALALAAGLWTIGQAAPAAAQNYGQNQQASGLTPRPTPAASDIIPCQPVGLSTQGCTAAGIVALASATVNTPCNGTGDDTLAIQAALNAGGLVTMPAGVCMVGNLTLTVPGTTLQGAGMLDGALAGVGTVLRARSGTSGAILTVGVANPSIYTLGVSIRNFALDMINMSDASSNIAYSQQNSWDDHVENLRVTNYGSQKVSYLFNAGAYITHFDNVAGGIVSYQGANSSFEATTISFTNSDITKFVSNWLFDGTYVGGAIQVPYAATTVTYLAPGVTPYGSYPPNTAGEYVAVASDIANTQSMTFVGTDFEQAGGFPTPTTTECGGVTTTWAYNDGTHGCLSLYPVVKVESTAVNTTFVNPNLAGIYILDYGVNTRIIGQPCCGGVKAINVHTGLDIATGIDLCVGTTEGATNLATYLSYGGNVTFQINCSSGASTWTNLTVQPATDALGVIDFYNAAGTSYFTCKTTSLACGYGNGADLALWSDNYNNKTIDLNGATGAFSALSAAIAGSLTAYGVTGRDLLIQPATDGVDILTLNNAAGSGVLSCKTSSTVALSACGMGNGADFGMFSDGAFTVKTIDLNGATGALSAITLTITVANGTSPLTVASQTQVANLNSTFLQGADWTSPLAIGGTAPAAGTFTAGKMQTLTVQPASDATGVINFLSAGGTNYFTCKTTSLACGYGNGTDFSVYSDSYTTKTIDLNGATGVVNATGGYQEGGTSGVTCTGTPTSSFATKGGIVTHC